MQICKRCGLDKPLDDFQLRKDTGKYRGVCKACITSDNLTRYHNRMETRDAHWEAHKRFTLKKYGLTQESYQALWDKQGGQCAICKIPMEPWGARRGKGVNPNQAVIDHCHEKGHVRGLLCSLCNLGLGKFRDNTDFLRNAANYLEDNQ